MSTAGPIRTPSHHAPAHAHHSGGVSSTPSAFAAELDKHAGVAAPTAAPSAAATRAYPAGTAGQSAATPAIVTPAACTVAGGLGRFVGRSTGSGQCVALVHAAHPDLGSTAHWVRGEPVQGNVDLRPGTPIATFSAAGRYANATNGSSHAAIYLSQNAHGVQVLDQWAGRPASVRTIPWSHPGAAAANTGAAFHVVRSA